MSETADQHPTDDPTDDRPSSQPAGAADVDAQILGFFDATVDEEWERMVATCAARVSHELHVRMQARHVRPGDRVLELGAGPGRFTLALARLGAHVTVTDLSAAQLDAARANAAAAGIDDHVEGFEVLDIRDLSRFGEESFDAVTAWGGPLSYVFDQAPATLAGIARVLRPGGVLLGSVMSNAGSCRGHLDTFDGMLDAFGPAAVGQVVATGDLRPLQTRGHTCQMYYSDDFDALVRSSPLEPLEYSASSWMATGDPDAVERISRDPRNWDAFLDWESAMAARPGCLDGGTHLLFAARRPA